MRRVDGKLGEREVVVFVGVRYGRRRQTGAEGRSGSVPSAHHIYHCARELNAFNDGWNTTAPALEWDELMVRAIRQDSCQHGELGCSSFAASPPTAPYDARTRAAVVRCVSREQGKARRGRRSRGRARREGEGGTKRCRRGPAER
eukprot:768462-Hanusia_phi.AAC.1